jgi:hypothetical protein
MVVPESRHLFCLFMACQRTSAVKMVRSNILPPASTIEFAQGKCLSMQLMSSLAIKSYKTKKSDQHH